MIPPICFHILFIILLTITNSSLLTLKAFDTVEENSILNNELFLVHQAYLP